MELLSFEEIRVGDRVLLAEPDPEYRIAPNNPAVGTSFECGGVVTDKGKFNVYVDWDNGTSNSYKGGELSIERDGVLEDLWNDI